MHCAWRLESTTHRRAVFVILIVACSMRQAHYAKKLARYQFQISMSRKGNPLDNAYAESFLKNLKPEEVHLWEDHTMEDVQRRIPYFYLKCL